MATGMLCDTQPDTYAIRGCSPRDKGSSRCAVGGVGSKRDAILCARDGFPVAPVSVLSHSPCCVCAYANTTSLILWSSYVHGTRMVCPILRPTGENRIEVLDFNVHALRVPTACCDGQRSVLAPYYFLSFCGPFGLASCI